MIPQITVKHLLLGMMIVLISLFLFVAISVGVLIEKKSFRTSIHGRITDTNESPIGNAKISLYIGGSDASENRFECLTKAVIIGWTPPFATLDSSCLRDLGISADGYTGICRQENPRQSSSGTSTYRTVTAPDD
jgi:hypothetical protein